jgi:hypothetical protein
VVVPSQIIATNEKPTPKPPLSVVSRPRAWRVLHAWLVPSIVIAAAIALLTFGPPYALPWDLFPNRATGTTELDWVMSGPFA